MQRWNSSKTSEAMKHHGLVAAHITRKFARKFSRL
jgi:hypothetical protein